MDRYKAIGELGKAYSFIGRNQEALKMWEEVLQVSKDRLEPNDPRTLNAMHNVALLYGQPADLKTVRRCLKKHWN